MNIHYVKRRRILINFELLLRVDQTGFIILWIAGPM